MERVTTDGQLLHARLELFEAFVETSDDAVVSLDAEARIASWNRSAERVFGFVEAEMLGERSTILFPEHLRSELEVVFETVMAGDRVDHLETEIQRKDGMPIPISLSMCAVFDAKSSLVASLLVARDITEQRLAQATLAEIEARLREAEALAHVGSWLWDLRTGVVQWTDELHRIHGVEPRAFDGTLDAHLASVHPEDRDRVRAQMENSVAVGRPFEAEYRVVRPGGEQRWVYERAEPTIGSAGTVVGLRGIGQDVTERPTRERAEEGGTELDL